MENRYQSMCFGGRKFLMVCITAVMLVLTFVNTVSARYQASRCSHCDVPIDASLSTRENDSALARYILQSSEISAQLNTHG